MVAHQLKGLTGCSSTGRRFDLHHLRVVVYSSLPGQPQGIGHPLLASGGVVMRVEYRPADATPLPTKE